MSSRPCRRFAVTFGIFGGPSLALAPLVVDRPPAGLRQSAGGGGQVPAAALIAARSAREAPLSQFRQADAGARLAQSDQGRQLPNAAPLKAKPEAN